MLERTHLRHLHLSGGILTMRITPKFECDRVMRNGAELYIFECPHCWTYGFAYGSGNRDVAPHMKRPKNAKPVMHVHGASNGHRAAHCFDGSPLRDTGYYLVGNRH